MTRSLNINSQHPAAPREQRVEKFPGGEIVYRTSSFDAEGQHYQLEVIESAAFYDNGHLENVSSSIQSLFSKKKSPAAETTQTAESPKKKRGLRAILLAIAVVLIGIFVVQNFMYTPPVQEVSPYQLQEGEDPKAAAERLIQSGKLKDKVDKNGKPFPIEKQREDAERFFKMQQAMDKKAADVKKSK